MPRAKKETAPPPKSQSPEEIEEAALELESQSLSERAAKELKPAYIKMLKKIAYYTAKVGLPLQESCILVDYPFEKFEEDMKLNPIIATVIRAKELEYKKDLLFTLSQRARGGDDKLAQWLLSRKYPDEYGEKKGGGGGDSDDLILEAFRLIRKRGDSTPLISPTSAVTAVVVDQSGAKTPVHVETHNADSILN